MATTSLTPEAAAVQQMNARYSQLIPTVLGDLYTTDLRALTSHNPVLNYLKFAEVDYSKVEYRTQAANVRSAMDKALDAKLMSAMYPAPHPLKDSET